jgi:hypothetical protein
VQRSMQLAAARLTPLCAVSISLKRSRATTHLQQALCRRVYAAHCCQVAPACTVTVHHLITINYAPPCTASAYLHNKHISRGVLQVLLRAQHNRTHPTTCNMNNNVCSDSHLAQLSQEVLQVLIALLKVATVQP